MSSRLERLAAQSPAATAAPAPSLDADDFSAQAPEAPPAPDPQQYAQAVADGVAQAAPGIAQAVAAAMPEQQTVYMQAPGRSPRRPPPVRVSAPRDPLDAFFPQANGKRLEVYRLIADTDGKIKESQVGNFMGADASGYPSMSEFVRQRVANRLRRWGDYLCKAIDSGNNIVGVIPVSLEAPPDAQATGTGTVPGADSYGSPIYGAVADILRAQAGQGGAVAVTPEMDARLRVLYAQSGQPGFDQAAIQRQIADLRVEQAQAQARAGHSDPLSGQVVPMLLKRLEEADRRNVAPPPQEMERTLERLLAAQEQRFQAQISALKPAPDPMAGIAALITAMGTINKAPDLAALITALRPEPVPPPPPPVAQPDPVDTLIRFKKASEVLEPKEAPPDPLEALQRGVAMVNAVKSLGGSTDGGNWAGVFGQLLKGGSDMIKEGSKALDKRVELEKATAERAKMQTVATVVQAKAAAGAPMAEVARAGAEAAAAVQQVAGEPGPAAAPAATPVPAEPTATASVADVFQAVGALGEAKTDSERVRRTLIVARTAEAAFPSEKARIRSVFAKAAAGDRAAAMADLREFIAGLVTQAGLAQAAADATLAAFEKHWDTLVARGVFGRPANGAGATAAAAPAPAAPATANGQAQQVAA